MYIIKMRRFLIAILFLYMFINSTTVVYALKVQIEPQDRVPIPRLEAYLKNMVTDYEKREGSDEALKHALQSIVKIAHAEGYYDAKAVIEERNLKHVRIRIDLGKVYKIASILQALPTGVSKLGDEFSRIKVGDILIAEKVLATEADIKRHIETNHPVLPVKIFHEVILDKMLKQAAIVFKSDKIIRAKFGATSIEGLNSINEARFRHLIPWKKGDDFYVAKIDEAYQNMLNAGLLESSQIHYDLTVNHLGEVPIIIRVKESKHRTINLGMSTSSYEPLAVGLGWEHRNLTGKMNRISINTRASSRKQSGEIVYLYPWWRNRSQSLELKAGVNHESWDAYELYNHHAEGSLSKDFNPNLNMRIGFGYEHARVDDLGRHDRYDLGFIKFKSMYKKMHLVYPMNASGRRTWFGITPYYIFGDEQNSFVRLEAEEYFMKPLKKHINWQGRLKLGFIPGNKLDTTPVHLRFFAGGADSLRGYSYREIGSFEGLDRNGGDGLFEASSELSYIMNPKWAIALFADAGNIFIHNKKRSPWLYTNAGSGIHYDTGFGIVKLDIAWPFTHRHELDKPFQYYLSFGEVF